MRRYLFILQKITISKLKVCKEVMKEAIIAYC